MSWTRRTLAAAGCGFGLWGLWLFFQTVSPAALMRLPLWLGGVVIADDFVLVPLIVIGGWVLTHRLHGAVVRPVGVTLLYAGITTLMAIPLLLRQGEGANPTILPRDYLRDWLLLEAALVAAGAIAVVLRLRRADGSRESGPRRRRDS
ncbi:hypothetical protein FB561_5730 [Kribbella amoyensis]|uniref:Uncharacterized protein n=1 Tax=Kribbella amoyensis TaxID=996641 RepID=A0A561C0E6_9ACTN|nr:hypothetical protein [Kribbella amoyensis]TWD84538.1 hypothetical protein FB561_5730 [Kribbella amoyensis]